MNITLLMRIAGITGVIAFMHGCSGDVTYKDLCSQSSPPSIQWDHPLTRVDGTPLSVSEIRGYRVYVRGSQSYYNYSIYSEVTTTAYSMSNSLWNSLPPDTYYFAITTMDTAGRQSGQSDEVIREKACNM